MTEVSSTSMVNDLLSRLDKVKERGGGKALGVSLVEKCECLYLSFEDNERRLKTRLCPQSTPPDGLRLFTEWLRLDDGGFEVLEEWLADHPDCRLVIIDTLQKVRPPRGARDSYEVDYELGSQLQKAAHAHNVAIVIIHNLPKTDADDIFDTVSASTDLTGSADGTLALARQRNYAREAAIGLVLLQQGKGADMGTAFGGGSFLTRATAVLATLFFY